MTSGKGRAGLAGVAVTASSLVIVTMVELIAGMVLAAVSFTKGLVIAIPFLVRFDGVPDSSGGPMVTISGSPPGLLVATAILSAPLCVLAMRAGRGRASGARSSAKIGG